MGLDDSDDETNTGRKFGDNEIKDTTLFSAQLLQGEDADRSTLLIPQYGLLGSVLGTKLLDTRIFLNTNIPSSFFVCGLQGSGKSHTLSTLLGELYSYSTHSEDKTTTNVAWVLAIFANVAFGLALRKLSYPGPQNRNS